MIWFSADLHFYHRNVIPYCNRPWATVEDMNEGLIERWNAKVRKNEHIYVLGDFCFGGTTRTKTVLDRLNGHKILVRGNHDAPAHKMIAAGFDAVYENEKIALGDRRVYLSHFPYHPEGDQDVDDRYLHKRIKDDGSWLLHGHVHIDWKYRGHMINVGCDVWNWEPVAADTLLALMEKIG